MFSVTGSTAAFFERISRSIPHSSDDANVERYAPNSHLYLKHCAHCVASPFNPQGSTYSYSMLSCAWAQAFGAALDSATDHAQQRLEDDDGIKLGLLRVFGLGEENWKSFQLNEASPGEWGMGSMIELWVTSSAHVDTLLMDCDFQVPRGSRESDVSSTEKVAKTAKSSIWAALSTRKIRTRVALSSEAQTKS